MDRQYINENELKQAYALADEVKRLINGLIAYLRKSGQNGKSSDPDRIRESPDIYSTDDSPPGNYQADDYQTDDSPPDDYPTDDYPTGD